jgi:hypothetical protein
VRIRPCSGGRATRSEAGQASLEWVGVLLLVALIIGALLMIGIPGQFSRSVGCAVQRIFGYGGGCMAGVSNSAVMPCPTSAVTRTASDELQVLFIDVGHKNTLIETRSSDGRVDFTLVDNGTLEAQAKLQAEAKIDGLGGFNAEATAAAGGELTGSYTFSFSDAASAAAFAKQVQSGGGWGVIAHDIAGGIPVAAPIAGGFLDLVGVHGAPNGASLADQYHRYLTSAFVGAGAAGQVKALASGELGPASGELGAELSGALGFREVYAGDPNDPGGPQKGDVQIYVKLDGNADASLMQALFGPKVAAQASGNGDAVITLDSSGHPKQLEITASGDAGTSGGLAVSHEGGSGGASEGSGSGGGAAGSGGGAAGSGGAPASSEGGGILKSLDLSSTIGAGQGYQYTATLDLSDNPQTAQDLVSLLNPSSAGPAMTQLINQINTNGQQRVQPYRQSSSQTGGGAVLEIADVGGGFDASVGSQNQHLLAGWVQNPGQGWQPVICKA